MREFSAVRTATGGFSSRPPQQTRSMCFIGRTLPPAGMKRVRPSTLFSTSVRLARSGRRCWHCWNNRPCRPMTTSAAAVSIIPDLT